MIYFNWFKIEIHIPTSFFIILIKIRYDFQLYYYLSLLKKMGRIIIEYCGGWGYGGPANRLKKAIAQHIPGIEI